MPPLIGDHTITYKFTDLLRFETIAELPLKGATFSKVVSGVGPWGGTLNVEDPGMRRANFGAATAVGKTAMWIDVDGALIYGGLVTKRVYDPTSGIITLSGSDFAQYLAMRLQAFDYENYTDAEGHKWAETGAPVLAIAYTILKQAMTVVNSIPVKIVRTGITAEKLNWITFSAPRAQEQTLASILSQLQELGFMVGVDYAADVEYVDGRPSVAVTLAYPRRGAQGKGPTTPVIEMTSATDWGWEEDSSQQATAIVEQAGATSLRSSPGEWEPATEAGYPLYEACITHPALAPTESPEQQLVAYLQGSLATNAFPFTIPSATIPMFETPGLLSLDAGDNALLRVTKSAGNLPPSCPIFVEGLELLSRIVRMDCVIPDEGVPTIDLTFNPPPSFQPVTPVIWDTGAAPEPGREKEEERTEEEREEGKEKEREEAESIAEQAEVITEDPEFKSPAVEPTTKELEEIKIRAHEAKVKAEGAGNRKEVEEAKAAAEAALLEAEAVKSAYEKRTWVISIGGGSLVKTGQTIKFASELHFEEEAAGGFPGWVIVDIENLALEKLGALNTAGGTDNKNYEPQWTKGVGMSFTATSNQAGGGFAFRIYI